LGFLTAFEDSLPSRIRAPLDADTPMTFEPIHVAGRISGFSLQDSRISQLPSIRASGRKLRAFPPRPVKKHFVPVRYSCLSTFLSNDFEVQQTSSLAPGSQPASRRANPPILEHQVESSPNLLQAKCRSPKLREFSQRRFQIPQNLQTIAFVPRRLTPGPRSRKNTFPKKVDKARQRPSSGL